MNNNTIKTEDGKELNLTELERKFGSYDFAGKTYYAVAQMERTNRVFPGWYGDAEEGETYADEWSAPGYDEEGNAVTIYMTFDQVRGEEVEDDGLDWYADASSIDAR